MQVCSLCQLILLVIFEEQSTVLDRGRSDYAYRRRDILLIGLLMVTAHASEGKPARIPSYGMVPSFSYAAHSVHLVLGRLRVGERLVLVHLLLRAQLRLRASASMVIVVTCLGHAADLLVVQEVVDDLVAVLNFVVWAQCADSLVLLV